LLLEGSRAHPAGNVLPAADVRHGSCPTSRYTREEFTHSTSGTLLHDNFKHPPDLEDEEGSFAQAAPRLEFPVTTRTSTCRRAALNAIGACKPHEDADQN